MIQISLLCFKNRQVRSKRGVNLIILATLMQQFTLV